MASHSSLSNNQIFKTFSFKVKSSNLSKYFFDVIKEYQEYYNKCSDVILENLTCIKIGDIFDMIPEKSKKSDYAQYAISDEWKNVPLYNIFSKAFAPMHRDNLLYIWLTKLVPYTGNLLKISDTFYKRNGFINFKNYCMSFDGLAYNNEPNILIVDQSEPHLLLLTEGYSYAKLTNNIGMYTKHPLILEILEKNNYNLNRTHYYKKNVNLKYLAKMNSLNFVDNKILLKGKGIKRNAREFLLKGNSVITVTLESKTNLPGSSLGEIKIVANKGLVNLYSYTFSKDDFKNGFFNKIIKIKTNNVLHDVVCQIKPFLNAEIYVSNITVEKIKE